MRFRASPPVLLLGRITNRRPVRIALCAPGTSEEARVQPTEVLVSTMAIPTLSPEVLARFDSKLLAPGRTGCVAWSAGTDRDGYGRFCIDSVKYAAHRIAYTRKFGAIPAGLVIDHLCKNRSCCNPDHLEAVTQKVNALRGDNGMRRRTHCPSGHEYDASNTYVDKSGRRHCRACHRVRQNKRRATR